MTSMAARRAPASKDADGALDELRAQLRIAGPTIVSMLLYKLPWLFSLKFAVSVLDYARLSTPIIELKRIIETLRELSVRK